MILNFKNIRHISNMFYLASTTTSYYLVKGTVRLAKYEFLFRSQLN